MKYLANIEALWFLAVKRKRAYAAVLKSYIELFQSRIPELVNTIINLMDSDVSLLAKRPFYLLQTLPILIRTAMYFPPKHEEICRKRMPGFLC